MVSNRATLATIAIALTPLLGVAVVRVLWKVQIPDMTQDVASIAKIHPLFGLLSSLGILMWWTSTTVWLFTAIVLRARGQAEGVALCIYSGLLSAYLGLDDLFQIHEYLAPIYLGMPEKAVYGLFAIATAVYLWRYRRMLLRPDGLLLLLSLVSLSASVVVDTVLEQWLWRLGDWTYFVEDGLKWVGICLWTSFCIVRCLRELKTCSNSDS